MTEEVKDAATLEQEKQAKEAEAKAAAEAKAKAEEEAKKNATVGDLLGGKKEEKKEVKMVPEAALLEYKNLSKDLKKELKELRESIESGATKKEVAEDLKKIAEEHNVDPEFLDKFAKSIKAQVEAEVEEKVSSKIKPMEEKDAKEKQDKAFEEHYGKVLEAMPEYKGIAQKDVIKALALDPTNAKKTFAEIFEKAYGHLLPNKKAIDAARANAGGKGITDIDFEKANTDKEYFAQIMADPELKAKYNKEMLQKMKL
jgi:colicin import membrane protein